jgi:hypothetical protein
MRSAGSTSRRADCGRRRICRRIRLVNLKKGDSDKAIADLDQSIQLDPNFGAAYHFRGIAYAEKDEDVHQPA